MQIGAGLEGSAYWSTGENPFIDQMKWSGTWISFNAAGSSPWDTGLEGEIPLDANGYPNAGIPYSTSGGLQKVRKVISANNRVALGNYVFLYDGYGEFSFYSSNVNSILPNRIEVTVTGTGNVWMHIDSSAPAPNHARNFRLVPIAQEFSYQQDVFRSNFMDRVSDFAALRFMDWFHTNGNPVMDWSERSTPSSFTQADSAGVCYEYAIELANRSALTPWINIPHLADSMYIVNMAQLWHNSLNPVLDIYVEYSNEVWNSQFSQTQWIQGNTMWYPSHWPANPHYDPNLNWAENEGKKQGWAINIFRDAWGADSNRVKRVLGTQSVNPWVSTNVIEGAQRQYDYLSPTWYFGISPNQANAFAPTTTAEQVIDTCREAFYSNLANYKAHYPIADSTGGEGIIYYEGGQHISAYGNLNNPVLQAFYDAQTHPNMYQLYDDVLDSIRSWGAELAMCFVMAGGNSQYGSWGHIQSVDSTPNYNYSPKYMALLDNRPPAVQLSFNAVQNQLQVFFTAQSPNAANWSWDFGDGGQSNQANPVHTYAGAGVYQVCLSVVDSNGCDATYCNTISVVDVGIDPKESEQVLYWPQPIEELVSIQLPEGLVGDLDIELYGLSGQLIWAREVMAEERIFNFAMGGIPAGIYLMELRTSGFHKRVKVVKQ